jgi:hypothetical protein
MRRLTAALCAVLIVLGAAVALGACGSKDIETPTGTIDIAKDQAAKSQIVLIKTGVAAYVATNGSAPPLASQEILGSFVQPWPENPWTKAPVVQGKTKGDIVYAPGAATAYTLGVVLSDGTVYNTP